MITVDNVQFRAGNKYLVQAISGRFEARKIHLIIGPNGAGKSTLIKLIAGQLPLHHGHVRYGDTDLARLSVSQLARIRAVLSQNVDLAFPMRVDEVVLLGRYPHFSVRPTSRDLEACRLAMERFDVQDMSDRDYMTLSGGEKQRVHFARVTAQLWDPKSINVRYLLLDEPLNSLDIYYQYDFMEKVRQLCTEQNLVVIGVIHDLNLAAKYADELTLLHQGKLLSTGTPVKVLTSENIKHAFHMHVRTQDEGGIVRVLF
ncbi:MAG: heme ABC transporter ATP-binding protein [Lewinellaceae bacterium]|nr:heme ABC transporter ATP-binding protein [Lewinellaceae bacterium]